MSQLIRASEDRMKRRTFLTSSLTAAAAVSLGDRGATAAIAKTEQEFYELRAYRIESAAKKKIISNYLERGLVPALNRMGINRVGVFTLLDNKEDLSIHTIIPYPSLEAFAQLHPRLEKDEEYLKAAAEYYAQPRNAPAYSRVESWFMKAFAGMPVIELPAQSAAKGPRIFELRIYESHTEDKARRKVAMFNDGEIQIMRDVKLAPVMYGEMLVGNNVPNLTYMLSADDMESHKSHWKAFSAHPEWDRMKKMEKYKGTVSKITNYFFAPTSYSQI